MTEKKSLKDFAATLGAKMEERKTELRSEVPATRELFDEVEKKELLAQVDEAANTSIEANKDDYEAGRAILIQRGMSPEEVNSMPYTHVLLIGNEISSDEELVYPIIPDKENTTKEDTVKENDDTDLAGYVPEDKDIELKDKKEDNILANTKFIPSEVKDEFKEKKEDITEKKVKELIGSGIVKFVDRPLNSYRRGIESKKQKLLAREKRGKCCEMPLPNSNLRLNIYELRQSAVLNAVSKEIMTSSEMAMKEKAIRDILDRSEVLCSDGANISTDELMRAISIDDMVWIQYGAAVANNVDKIPYTVRCARCGTVSEITLDVVDRVNIAVDSIPTEIITEFSPADDFKTCILKSKAGISAIVRDEESRTKVYISNPSLYKSIVAGDMTRKIVCSKFAHLIPERLTDANIDERYDHIVQNHSTSEVIQLTSALILASYVDKIEYFELGAPLEEWDDDKYLDFTISEDDTLEAMVDAIVNIEVTTVDAIENTLSEVFVKHSVNLTTGPWKCHECKYDANESGVSGLMLLISTLQSKMQTQR